MGASERLVKPGAIHQSGYRTREVIELRAVAQREAETIQCDRENALQAPDPQNEFLGAGTRHRIAP